MRSYVVEAPIFLTATDLMGLKDTFQLPPAILPPPVYAAAENTTNSKLTSALWLRVLSHLRSEEEWYHLHREIRLTCRAIYAASMHMIRARYTESYLRRVRPPYTSNPSSHTSALPSYSAAASDERTPAPSGSPSREARVLDHYCAFRITREYEQWQSSLMLDDDAGVEEDLFAWLQPQTRIEDLLLQQSDASAIVLDGPAHKVHFADLTVGFRVRTAAILLPFESAASSDEEGKAARVIRKNLFEIKRERSESLETTASRLVEVLRGYRLVRKMSGRTVWYEVVGRAPLSS